MTWARAQPKWSISALTSAAMMPVLYAENCSGMLLQPMPLLSKVQHLRVHGMPAELAAAQASIKGQAWDLLMLRVSAAPWCVMMLECASMARGTHLSNLSAMAHGIIPRAQARGGRALT